MGVSSAVRGGALGAVSGGLPQDAGQPLGEWWGSGMGRPRRDLYEEMELERWLEQQFPAVRPGNRVPNALRRFKSQCTVFIWFP